MNTRMMTVQEVSFTKVKSSFVFCLFLVWLVISSVYYIEQLLSGDIVASYEDSILSKAAKYLIVLSFSLLFLIRAGSVIAPLLIAMLLGVVFIWYVFNPKYIYLFDGYVVILTMVGLCSVLGNATYGMIVRLSKVVVFTGVLVSFIAVLEVSFLSNLYASHWEATGGVRAVSTLLNPNNLGVYLGACLILCLAIPGSVLGKTLSVIVIMIGMYLSGSRTAWLAFVVVFSLWSLRFCMGRAINTSRLVFVFLAVFVGVTLALVLSSQAVEVERLQDFTSANIRLEKYSIYLNGFGVDYLIPDLEGVRLYLVSESSYFLLINAFGLIGLACVAVLVFLLYGFRVTWIPFFPYVVLYYVVVGLFENMVNSFPNNQLFLLSLGSIFCLRPFAKQKTDIGLHSARYSTL